VTASLAFLIGRRALDARTVLPLVWPHHVRVHGSQRVTFGGRPREAPRRTTIGAADLLFLA